MPVNQTVTDTTGYMLNVVQASDASPATIALNAGGTGAATETVVFIAPVSPNESYINVNRVTVTPTSAITGAGTHWNIVSMALYKTDGSAYATPPAGTYTTQTSLGKYVSKNIATATGGFAMKPGEVLTIKNTGNDSTGAATPALVVNVEYSIIPYI